MSEIYQAYLLTVLTVCGGIWCAYLVSVIHFKRRRHALDDKYCRERCDIDREHLKLARERLTWEQDRSRRPWLSEWNAETEATEKTESDG